jgi:hypothetical protein
MAAIFGLVKCFSGEGEKGEVSPLLFPPLSSRLDEGKRLVSFVKNLLSHV